jgi:dolichyl-phosphate-mannose-protein mannosyltransferase
MRPQTNTSGAGWIALAAILLLALGLMFSAARGDSAVMDELAHIPAGYGYVAYLSYELNPEHPPLVKALAALPLKWLGMRFPTDSDAWTRQSNAEWTVGRQFLYESGNDANRLLLAARAGPMLLTLLTTAVLYIWSRRRFGPLWGLLPAVLFGLSPHVLAHGHYVTTDVAAACGVVLATWAFLEDLHDPSAAKLMLAGIAFGAAQISKFSAVLLIPYFILLAVCWSAARAGSRSRAAARLAGVFLIGYVVIVYPTYFLLTRGYSISRQTSDTVHNLATYENGPAPEGEPCRPQRCPADLVVWMSAQPVWRPLAAYAEGVLMVRQRTSEGGKTYWLGRTSGRGSRWYFPIVYLLKEPIPALVLVAVGAGLSLRRRWSPFGWTQVRQPAVGDPGNGFTDFALALWCGIYWLSSVQSPLNIGFRHLFPTLPFVYMLTAGAWREWTPKAAWLKPGLVALLLVWFIGETASASPFFLSSFNEFGGGRSDGYRYATDSNFDWGQDLLRLREFADAHPEVDRLAVDYFGGGALESAFSRSIKAEPWSSARGNPADAGIHWLAISASVLQTAVQPTTGDLARPPQDEYRWLTSMRPRDAGFGAVPHPDYRAGTSIFIYHLP